VRTRRARERLQLDFGPAEHRPPEPRSRVSALTAGVALAVAVHGVALGALLWSAQLAPVRERLIRVVLYARQAETIPAEQPPRQLSPAPPEPAPAPAVARKPRPAPSLLASQPAPEPSPSAPVEDATAPPAVSASAPVAAAREPAIARPRYKLNPEPQYPTLARRRRQEGIVLLAVLVDAAGRPEAVEVQVSSGFASLDDAAVTAVKSWQFEPGRRDGEPIASRVEVPIRFQLERP
jgi:protein TonB